MPREIYKLTERIEQVRTKLRFSKTEFCEKIGFPVSTYNSIAGNRGSKPPSDLILAVVANIPVNTEWLLGRGGPMFDDPETELARAQRKLMAARTDEEREEHRQQFLAAREATILTSARLEMEPELPSIITIRRKAVAVSAGDGAIVETEEEREPWFFSEAYYRRMIRHNPKQVMLVDVMGDSMHPTLVSGDVVGILVTDEKEMIDGMWVVRLGNALVVKRVQYLVGGRLLLVSDNPAYKPQELDLTEEQSDFQLIGRVVWAPRHF